MAQAAAKTAPRQRQDQHAAKPSSSTEATTLLGADSPRPSFPFVYRPDIDGLRAVAVVSVIVYHSDPDWLPGGFLGVDVFFVISGYVVTGSLLLLGAANQPQLGLGSYLARFYARRLKRLTPALVLCVLGTTLLLLLLLGVAYSEPALQDCYSAAQLALIGGSNLQFAFARESYWADQGLAAQKVNPLLHTWSLGVEEQFYALFPCALWLTHGSVLRRGTGQSATSTQWTTTTTTAPPRWALAVLATAAALSATACPTTLLWSREQPLVQAVFYLLPWRLWQLLSGALVCDLLHLRPGLRTAAAACVPAAWHSAARDALALASALLVGLGLTLGGGGDDARHWAWGSCGVLGAVCYLVAGAGTASPGAAVATPARSPPRPLPWLHAALSTAAPRYVGRISYNLYLWHWPAIVLGKFLVIDDDVTPLRHLRRPAATSLAVLAALLVGVCMPVLSYRVVESPVRAWQPAKPAHAITAMLALIGGAEAALAVARGPTGNALQMWSAARIMGGSWVDVMAAMAFTGSHGANPTDGALRFGRAPGGGEQQCACQMAPGSVPPDHGGLATTDVSAPYCTADVRGKGSSYFPMQLRDGGSSSCLFAVDGAEGSEEVTQCLAPDRSGAEGLPRRAIFVIGDSHSHMMVPALALAARGAYQVHSFGVMGCGVMEAGFSELCDPHLNPGNEAHRADLASAMRKRLSEVVEAGDLVVVVEMINHWANDLASHDTPAGSFGRLRDAVPAGARILLIGDTYRCQPADAPAAESSSKARKQGAETMRSLALAQNGTYFFDAYGTLTHTWDECINLPNTSTPMWKEIADGQFDGHLSLAGVIYLWGPLCKAMHESGLLHAHAHV